ncbi:MAG: LamG domain-containing protein [Bradymonadaceae bacterium]|nr:LamG domain-containing protein [Lujinxingiaceae bacterium]
MSKPLLKRLKCIALVSFMAATLGNSPAYAQVHGMYTDKAVYEPGDEIEIYASAPQATTLSFALIRHGASDERVLNTAAVVVESQPTRVGSFAEVEGLSLGGRSAFTLEGWWYPTLVGGDHVMVAGQGDFERGAGITVNAQGQLGAYVDTGAEVIRVVQDAVLAIDRWHHLALSFDGAQLVLYRDAQPVAVAAAAAVAPVAAPFRIGASARAPGNMSGIIDGRIDAWALWPRALSAQAIEQRRLRSATQPDAAPLPDEVDLYLGFDDPYGRILDRSQHAHAVKIVNHGSPRMVGVHEDGFSLRLNHDQLVDAGWARTATLRVPTDARSGLYSIEAPGFDARDKRWPPLQTSVVVRPKTDGEKSRIAVIVPVNTWVAYNPWPGYNFDGPPDEQDYFPARQRTPDASETVRSANNSAYMTMGDGVSLALFQGWRRPNRHTSVASTAGYAFDLRAKLSLETVQWLEQKGIDYDLYTDWDLGDARLDPADYGLVFVHGHSEYWSRRALDHAQAFLDAGGSFLFMSANAIYWHVAHGDGHQVQEGRKWPTFVRPTALGANDRVLAISGEPSGLWELIAQCEDAIASPTLLHGATFDILTGGHPTTFGRWEVEDADHWLWPSGLRDGDRVGQSRYEDIFTVGHEGDSYVPNRPPPGLAAGATVSLLATGTAFPASVVGKLRRNLAYQPDCNEIAAVHAGLMSPTGERHIAVTEDTRAGSILYYPHRGGGHVLTIGSTAAVWALQSDPAISGLAERAIDCFAYQRGCHGEDSSLPGPPGDELDEVDDAAAGLGGQGPGHCGCALAPPAGDAAGLIVLLGLLGLLALSRRLRAR